MLAKEMGQKCCSSIPSNAFCASLSAGIEQPSKVAEELGGQAAIGDRFFQFCVEEVDLSGESIVDAEWMA
ncbi:uncharacterized protein A4U43_C06F13460 [Asparagus officinalis]|uniref:Uncharacterized protein n=1 Tax=Asparagus officinalis TaxID=4686 RepID=A0A5P1ELN3_ASPOF|nr:uncharacterized protein A4U43_C06F13460 [Asparagus officinalis]